MTEKMTTTKHENNMFPVIKMDYSGKIIYHNAAAMPILNYWQCKLNSPVNNQLKTIYPQIFDVKTPQSHDATVRYLDYVFHFSVIPYEEAGYIGIYGFCIENAEVVAQTPAIASSAAASK